MLGGGVEPLHLAGALAESPQGHAPDRHVAIHRQQEASRGRGVAARQAGDLGIEPLVAEDLGDGAGVLGCVGPEQAPGMAEPLLSHGVHDEDFGAALVHRPSPPADRSPATPSMLARFFSALYRSMPSGPFLLAYSTNWDRSPLYS